MLAQESQRFTKSLKISHLSPNLATACPEIVPASSKLSSQMKPPQSIYPANFIMFFNEIPIVLLKPQWEYVNLFQTLLIGQSVSQKWTLTFLLDCWQGKHILLQFGQSPLCPFMQVDKLSKDPAGSPVVMVSRSKNVIWTFLWTFIFMHQPFMHYLFKLLFKQ